MIRNFEKFFVIFLFIAFLQLLPLFPLQVNKHICNNIYNFLKGTSVVIAGITFVSWPS